jgi:micrococcal nuclease
MKNTKSPKSPNTIVVSLITLLLSLGLSAAAGQNVDVAKISNELFGIKSTKVNTGNCKPNSTEEVTIVRVVDGDTIEVAGGCGDKIRLLYIDTPETVKPNAPVDCYGPEASSYSKSQLKVNTKVYLKSDKEATDRYGRDLRILYFNNVDIDTFEKSYNYQLAKTGYGVAKFYSPNITYKKQMLEAENQAKTNNLGLWSKCSK